MRVIPRSVATLIVVASSAIAQRPAVKLPPKPDVPPPKAVVLPKITYDSLANGLRFAVIENHELPLVIVQTAVSGQGSFGTWMIDPPGKQGAFGLLLASLREGTATRTATQISDELTDLGIDARLTTAPSFGPPALAAARSVWRPGLDLLADLLMNPTLPEAGVSRVQSTVASSIERLGATSLANRGMIQGLYGGESLYGKFATSASIKGITHDDVVAMKDAYLRPQNLIVVLAGDVSVAEAREGLRKSFGGWQRGGTTIAIRPPRPTPQATTIYLKDNPGSNQAVISAGQLVPGRDNEDAVTIDALALVLGDFSVSSGSRIYKAFRIDRGLSYAPSVSLGTRPLGEMVPLYANLSVSAGVADTAINVLLSVMRELKQDKPTEAGELDFATRNLAGSLPGSIERLDVIAGMIASEIRDRAPSDYLDKWIGHVSNLTLPEVQAAAAKYIDPQHMAFSVIADRSKVEAALRGTGIPVVIIP